MSSAAAARREPVATTSLWLDGSAKVERRPSLTEDARCAVAVIGGGIAGLTSAYLLAREGVDVVLLEAAEIGSGTTGNTTAKVSSAHGLCYSRLVKRHGEQTARAYGELNEAAIAYIDETRRREAIECSWRERDAWVYTTDAQRSDAIEAECQAAVAAGLDAALERDTPLPFRVEAAMRVGGQAEFHPVRWCRGLAAAAERHGARIFEHSRACEVSARGGCEIRTDSGGTLSAERAILATHYPTLDRGLFFARLRAQRSYCISLRIAGEPPPGMYISIDEPTRSLRSYVPELGSELLIVGGQGHKVGQEAHTSRHYAALESWARINFAVEDVVHRWSAQDPMPPDGLPYVGALTIFGDRVLVATGFQKWGMTNGTAAAQILVDRILGREHPHARVFDSNRFDPLAAGPALVKENADVARHLVGDRLAAAGSADHLAPGSGGIVRVDGKRAAGFRDERGALHLLSSACTHLGCELRFNDAERSWDCPCHGSRFDAVDGRVIEGPAVSALSPVAPA
jgi:glycine/D-amino acid oxidase-like deaminating enzyme/nitrite reductase/ring-hydroxylating ferredoxin subunit